MVRMSDNHSRPFAIPLASFQWLKYLGLVAVVLGVYIVAQCYYHYADDLFSKSLTIGQHLQMAIYAICSMIAVMICPLLFFSGALVYRSVRLKGMPLPGALARDLLVILPLGVFLWYYSAYLEQPVSVRFYARIFRIQQLEPGEKLQDTDDYELFQLPGLKELNEKREVLEGEIADFEKQYRKEPTHAMASYIDELKRQREKCTDEIQVIHFTPFYTILFLVFGLLLGYLLPIHRAALVGILIAVGYSWYLVSGVLGEALDFGYSEKHRLLLLKIGLLCVINAVLFVVALQAMRRNEKRASTNF